MATKTKTIAEIKAEIRAFLIEQGVEETSEWVSRLDADIEQLSKKRKPSKADVAKQEMNAKMVEAIEEMMEPGVEYSVVDIKEQVEELAMASPQKIASLMKVLVDGERVTKSQVTRDKKRVVVWTLA